MNRKCILTCMVLLVLCIISGCGGSSYKRISDTELIEEGMYPDEMQEGWEWGDDVKCELEDGTLTIYGEGSLPTEGDCGIDPEDAGEIVELIVEDGITGINAEYFGSFENVERVTLGKDVLYIGRRTFKNATKLKEINIPDSVVCIRPEAFYGCESLGSVVADGDALKYVSEDAFNGCYALENVILGKNLEIVENLHFIIAKVLRILRSETVFSL